MGFELSQVFIIFSGVCLLSSFYMKERWKQLIFLVLANAFYLTHFFLLGAITGGAILCLCLIRNIVNFLYERKFNKKTNIYLVLVFDILAFLICVLTFANWISILPAAAIIIYNTLFIFDSTLINRISIILHSGCYIAYNYIICSYTAFGTEIIALLCAFVLMIMCLQDMSFKKKNEFQVANDSVSSENDEKK